MSYADEFKAKVSQPTVKVTSLPTQPKLTVVTTPNSTPGNLQGGAKPVQVQQTAPVQGAKPVAKPQQPVIPQASKAPIVIPAPSAQPQNPEPNPIRVVSSPVSEDPNDWVGGQDLQNTIGTTSLQPAAYADQFARKVGATNNNYVADFKLRVSGVDGQDAPEYKAPEEKRKSLVDTFWQQIDMKTEQDKYVANFAKSVAQGTARSGGAVVLTLAGRKEFDVDESSTQAEKLVKKIVFGDGALKDFSGVGEETLDSFGADGLAKNKYASFALGGTLSALDFTGAGKTDDVLKALAKTRNIDEVIKTLRTIGVAEDMVDSTATRIAVADSVDQVKAILDHVGKFQEATKIERPAIRQTVETTAKKVADIPENTPMETLDDLIARRDAFAELKKANPDKPAFEKALKNIEKRIESAKKNGMPEDPFTPKKQGMQSHTELQHKPQEALSSKGSNTLEIPSNSATKIAQEFPESPHPAKKLQELDQSTSGGSQNKISQNSSYDASMANNAEKVKPPVVRGGLKAPEVDFKAWKDKPTFGLARETLERNIERIAGKDAEKVKDFIIHPVRENEAARIRMLKESREELKTLSKQYNIPIKSKDDALVMAYGENRIGLDELKKETNNWENVVKFANYFKGRYDELLQQVNKSRSRFGYEPIPRREDYFRHFDEMNTVISQFGIMLRKQELPTEIAGMTDIFKPGKPFSTAEMRRLGGKFTETAIGGMDNYLESIGRQIYHIDSLQRYRALEKYIRDAGAAHEATLPNFVANLMDSGNALSGKKVRMDRAVESILGRNAYSLLDAIKRRTSANMVGANVSSALTNIVPFTQSLATTSKPAALRGIFYSLQNILGKDADLIDNVSSSFLVRRFGSNPMPLKWTEKAAEKGQWLFGAIDRFVSTAIVSGKYYENLAKGKSVNEAMSLADEYAGKIMGDRSLGQMPLLFESKSLGALTQFQLEVNNMVSFLIRDVPKISEGSKLKLASSLGQFVIYSYLYNEAFSMITGRRPTFDPLKATLDSFGLTDDTEGMGTGERIKKAGEDVIGSLPFGNVIYEGGKVPISSVLPDPKKVLDGEFLSEFKKPLPLFLPTGGSQIKKTYGGIKGFLKGKETDKDGDLKYRIDKNPVNFFRSILFGKSSTPEAREYYKQKEGGLTDAEVKIKHVYDEAQVLKAEGKLDEAKELVNNLSEEDQKTYVEYKKKQTENNSDKLRPRVQEIYNKAQDLKDDDKFDEAKKFVNESLNDEEKKIYEDIKKEAAAGKNNADKTTEGNFIKAVLTYAKAIGSDPVTAFNRILTDQKIRRVDNGAIIVYRMSMKDSEALKKESDQANPDYKLDHTIPLQLGGSNTEDNLKIVSTDDWSTYTPVENHLGKQLRAGKISKKEAQQLIKDFKAGKISKDEVMGK